MITEVKQIVGFEWDDGNGDMSQKERKYYEKNT